MEREALARIPKAKGRDSWSLYSEHVTRVICDTLNSYDVNINVYDKGPAASALFHTFEALGHHIGGGKDNVNPNLRPYIKRYLEGKKGQS